MLLVSKILENFEEVSNSMLKRNIDVKAQEIKSRPSKLKTAAPIINKIRYRIKNPST